MKVWTFLIVLLASNVQCAITIHCMIADNAPIQPAQLRVRQGKKVRPFAENINMKSGVPFQIVTTHNALASDMLTAVNKRRYIVYAVEGTKIAVDMFDDLPESGSANSSPRSHQKTSPRR